MARKQNDPTDMRCQAQDTHMDRLREMEVALRDLKLECWGEGWRRSSEDKVIRTTDSVA